MDKHLGKIIATLGPASELPERIEELVRHGANLFRLNFSHGSHDQKRRLIGDIRALEKKTGVPIGIIADLQGPKLRIGDFENEDGVTVTTGEVFNLHLAVRLGDRHGVTLPHPEIFSVMRPDMDILIDDGNLRLRVVSVDSGIMKTIVMTGGSIKSRKGVNVPAVELPVEVLTEKDTADLAFATEQRADWIALSFVQHPEDVRQLRERMPASIGIIAKIEKPSAVEHIDAIIEAADAVMVARGDLGVEIPAEDVPGVQKDIINRCRQAGKPVIVATHMLDSMTGSPRPTRAEVSDVANALYDGADAVMLSAETAAGDYPVESVSMMRRILARNERSPAFIRTVRRLELDTSQNSRDAIVGAVHTMADRIQAKAVVVFSSTGRTTVRCSRHRFLCPLVGVTPSAEVSRQLTLMWGVHSIRVDEIGTFREMTERASVMARENGFAGVGDKIIIIATVPPVQSEPANTVRVVTVS